MSPLSSTQNVVVTIKGINDAPVITSVTPTSVTDRTIPEFSNTAGSSTKHSLSGEIIITDSDSNTNLAGLTITPAQAQNSTYPGLFTIDAPDANGRAVWHYSIEDKYLDALNGPLPSSGGQAAVDAARVTIDNVFTVNDNSGVPATSTVTGHVYVTLLGVDGI